MIRYLGKCADVEVNPGWERLQVVWKHNIDAGVKKVKITWKSDKGSGEMFANPCDPDSEDLMDTVYIDNLGDAMYTVRVNNVDANGRESLVEENTVGRIPTITRICAPSREESRLLVAWGTSWR